ncbi:hypothetical protein SprV_0200731500 [Sparganum proliferum]
MICGDLIDAQPGNPDRFSQSADLMRTFENLHPEIGLLVLPGNHDVGDRPSANDLTDYRSLWGDDYFSFSYGKCKFIVVNSQLFWDPSNCGSEAALQDAWLRCELSASKNKLVDHIIVFQHIPPFTEYPDEKDDYFNLPKENRLKLLHLYHDAGVRFVFSGHLHRNGGGFWAPSDGSPPLEVVSSSAVGVQLGSDSPGLRIVHVSAERGLTHKPSVYRSFSTNGTRKGLEFAVPLTTGKHVKIRPTRPLSPVKSDPEFKGKSEFRIAAYGISQLIEIAGLTPTNILAYDYHNIELPPDVSSEVRFFSRPGLGDPTAHRDILVFRSGVCVFWNAPDAECRQMLASIRKYCDAPVSPELIEWEELRYFLTTGDTFLDGEDICLHHSLSMDNTQLNATIDSSAVFEKLAFSDALALSVKLSLLEASFDSVARQMQPWIEKMKTGLGTFFSQSAVFRKTGELFTLRHLLNVSTNITETPDFYWDRPEVEKLFQQLKSALSIQSRTKILNTKLDTCCELAEILTNHLQARHSSRLEWMIIALILVEVIFEFHRLYEKWQVKECTTSAVGS